MKVNLEIKLKPWVTPNFVCEVGKDDPAIQGEIEEVNCINVDRKFHVSELDSAALEKMCEEFTDAVFKKAKKRRLDSASPGHKCSHCGETS